MPFFVILFMIADLFIFIIFISQPQLGKMAKGKSDICAAGADFVSFLCHTYDFFVRQFGSEPALTL